MSGDLCASFGGFVGLAHFNVHLSQLGVCLAPTATSALGRISIEAYSEASETFGFDPFDPSFGPVHPHCLGRGKALGIDSIIDSTSFLKA